jgi:lycopene cyclase domain-containing protein
MTYTLAVTVGACAAVVLDVLVLRTRMVTRRAFWTAYAIVLFFQLVVNGLLTGLKIVRYDASAIVGWRIAYAPVEDLLFGFALALSTLSLWVWLGRRGVPPTRRADRSVRSRRDAEGAQSRGG